MHHYRRVVALIASAATALAVSACGSPASSTARPDIEPWAAHYTEIQRPDAETVLMCGCDNVGIEFCKRYPVGEVEGVLAMTSDETLICGSRYPFDG